MEFWIQPKVSFLTGKVSGGEALIRWRRESGGILPAGAWLPVAKEHGLMQEIATATFPLLCADIRQICEQTDDIKVAFNMEAGDLENTDIVGRLLEAVENGVLDPSRIQIELTEASLPRDGHAMEDNIKRLTATGISLAMDDFGTGFSSLDTLRKLPFSTVKIDQGVVMTLQESTKSSAIVLSSIRMAYEMGLTVVAEGVESEEIYDVLQQAGCSEAQGYWLSKALPLHKFIRFANSGKQWQATPIGQLRHVEIDHLLWCKNILATVFGDSSGGMNADSVHAISDHKACSMGQWLDGKDASLVNIEEFRNLAQPHADLHQVGHKLVMAARQGQSMEELKKLAVEFNRGAEALMHGLQALEIQVLMAGINDSVFT
ncbi:MAG: EAL domain-containing protein [Planctomycetes bacterium]|nr:EAL domain-containing protein [Planctomycetota bacterium]MCP4770246.1 EAL domain-containing protein [Planctomycetota bacterium]MCP4860606.1 EAL domain-containing protein [Planctomycetota bacterium]